MTDERVGALLRALADYYWSIPVRIVEEKIQNWYPEVSTKQIKKVLDQCNQNIFRYHCCVETEDLEEPELVVEHLFAITDEDFKGFIAARLDIPFCDCEEKDLYKADNTEYDLPELDELTSFGRTELGLDGEWIFELKHGCAFAQAYALQDGMSWVLNFLDMQKLGGIKFQSIEQVERFRDLGNKLYQVLPNPVLRGWRPMDLENPPVLRDDIPEKLEDIPDIRPMMEELIASLGGREKFQEVFEQNVAEATKKPKIGRNDPCPCGSGKKYKKCCGR